MKLQTYSLTRTENESWKFCLESGLQDKDLQAKELVGRGSLMPELNITSGIPQVVQSREHQTINHLTI